MTARPKRHRRRGGGYPYRKSGWGPKRCGPPAEMISLRDAFEAGFRSATAVSPLEPTGEERRFFEQIRAEQRRIAEELPRALGLPASVVLRPIP